MKQLIIEQIELLTIKSKQVALAELEAAICPKNDDKTLNDLCNKLNMLWDEYSEIEKKIAELLEQI